MRLVASCQEDIRKRAGEAIRLTVCLSRPLCEVNGSPLELPPREHLLLLFLARRFKQAEPPLPSQKDALAPLNLLRLEAKALARSNDGADWRHAPSLQSEIDELDLRRALSNLREKILALRGDAAALAACLPEGRRPFCLTMPPSLVFIK